MLGQRLRRWPNIEPTSGVTFPGSGGLYFMLGSHPGILADRPSGVADPPQ